MSDAATLAANIKAEILADIASGRIPATVSSFSELHDYVDANMYGVNDDLAVDGEEFAAFCEVLNDAQNIVDAWLINGRV